MPASGLAPRVHDGLLIPESRNSRRKIRKGGILFLILIFGERGEFLLKSEARTFDLSMRTVGGGGSNPDAVRVGMTRWRSRLSGFLVLDLIERGNRRILGGEEEGKLAGKKEERKRDQRGR